MTDYETATLAISQATLAIGQESLRVSSWQSVAVFAQAVVTLVIGGIQCGLIYVGLRRLGEASVERKAQHEETMQVLQNQRDQDSKNHEQATKNHEQAMQNHEATMAQLRESHEQSTQSHEATMLALRGLLGAKEADH